MLPPIPIDAHLLHSNHITLLEQPVLVSTSRSHRNQVSLHLLQVLHLPGVAGRRQRQRHLRRELYHRRRWYLLLNLR